MMMFLGVWDTVLQSGPLSPLRLPLRALDKSVKREGTWEPSSSRLSSFFLSLPLSLSLYSSPDKDVNIVNRQAPAPRYCPRDRRHKKFPPIIVLQNTKLRNHQSIYCSNSFHSTHFTQSIGPPSHSPHLHQSISPSPHLPISHLPSPHIPQSLQTMYHN